MSKIQTTEYKEFIKRIKIKAQQAQIKASVRVNSTLLEFYWELGNEIVEKQKSANWGSAFLKNMSQDLMREFPNMKGFSHRNLKYIRQWYLFYFSGNENGQQVVAHLIQIPWGHNLHIITKSKNTEEALFYVQKTIENSWSRSVLVHQVESLLYERQGKALSNFSNTLPKPQSDLANEILKDPYNFDFLSLTDDYKERELENALIDNVSSFLLELPKELESSLPSIEEIEEELNSMKDKTN